MALECLQQLERPRVPHVQGSVLATRREELAVRAHRDSKDVRSVPVLFPLGPPVDLPQLAAARYLPCDEIAEEAIVVRKRVQRSFTEAEARGRRSKQRSRKTFRASATAKCAARGEHAHSSLLLSNRPIYPEKINTYAGE